MAINSNPINTQNQGGRFSQVPTDIVIPVYNNMVHRKRYDVGAPALSNFGTRRSLAGTANFGHSVVDVVEKAISEGRITANVTGTFNCSQLNTCSMTDLGDVTSFSTNSGAGTITINGVTVGSGSGGNTDLSLGSRNNTSLNINSSTGTNVNVPQATTSLAGLLNAADKTKLDGITSTPTSITVDGTTISQADGSETVVNQGTNTTVTGSGTSADPYVINASGGGTLLTVQDEGASLATSADTLNFVGTGVTASGTGATKTITINGGGSALEIFNEGVSLSSTVESIDFVGAGVTATNTGSDVTVTINGGSSNFSWRSTSNSFMEVYADFDPVVTRNGAGNFSIDATGGTLSQIKYVQDRVDGANSTVDVNNSTIFSINYGSRNTSKSDGVIPQVHGFDNAVKPFNNPVAGVSAQHTMSYSGGTMTLTLTSLNTPFGDGDIVNITNLEN